METAGKMMDELRAALADAEELLRVTAGQAGPAVQEARACADTRSQSASPRAPLPCSARAG